MHGKRAKEVVLWILLFLCLAVMAGLLLLCAWEMYSQGFTRFLVYAVFFSIVGAILSGLCVEALANAEIMRKKIQVKMDAELMMHIENKTIINNKGGEIIFEAISEQELSTLKKENEALKQTVKNLGHTVRETEKERATERQGYQNLYNSLLDKYERRQDEIMHYQRLFNSMREKHKTAEKEWRGRLEISHLEQMELRAWRKTEKARIKREAKLRSRVHNIRQRKKVNGLVTAACDLAVSSKVARELDILDHHLEIANAIIALAEYLRPFEPSEELRVYLWDCRTVETLLKDIGKSAVATAFGGDWEEHILAGLIGLNVIKPFNRSG